MLSELEFLESPLPGNLHLQPTGFGFQNVRLPPPPDPWELRLATHGYQTCGYKSAGLDERDEEWKSSFIDEEMIRTKSPSKNFITVALHLMDKMTELDVSESAKAVMGEIWDCHNGVEVRNFIKLQYHSFCSIGIGFAHLLFELAAEGSEDPLAVLLPPRHSGALSLYAEGDSEWELFEERAVFDEV
ncbi:hypothetical protein K435DRAFT_860745 [Dendrothele bispora CBS 962.96]|uniref:Uncharacterized protein n=1 Tax=Dendrothele bispora (strain CBS 962.96) TaxID=1314807 RepID=A0A4S8LX76_DENBC|nr:hypothetical protein K435DRAFT_860745 [Dendrothele bispora CBS 962.96]